MKPTTDQEKIKELLTRGVERVYPNTDFLREKLISEERLTVYLGIDPTGPTLHLGHVVPLLKLRQFQDLGHRTILLIGDFTATIGDPSGKSKARKSLGCEQVMDNTRIYKEQAGRILDLSGANKAELLYNSAWLSKITLEELLELSSKITYAQLIKRDMFQARIAEGADIQLNEFLYPLMQGYDSVAMDVDGEVGGNDQTFNMLVGRDLAKKLRGKDKFVISMKLLVDASGKKIGKTEGNMVPLSDTAEDMFGKIMSWPDERILPGFELCTDVPQHEIAKVRAELESGKNPRDAKAQLARGIVTLFYTNEIAKSVEQEFTETFREKRTPSTIQRVSATAGEELREVALRSGVVASKSDFQRLVLDKAVEYNRIKVTNYLTKVEGGGVLKIGPHRFIEIENR